MHTGQTIIASITNPREGLDFTLSGVTKVKEINKKITCLRVTQENGSIAIGYGPRDDRSKRQIKKLTIDNNKASNNQSQQ